MSERRHYTGDTAEAYDAGFNDGLSEGRAERDRLRDAEAILKATVEEQWDRIAALEAERDRLLAALGDIAVRCDVNSPLGADRGGQWAANIARAALSPTPER